MRRLVILTLIGLFLFSISGRLLAQSGQKIGFVDLSKAFDEYKKTKTFDKSLEKKGDIKQAEREKLVIEIRKMRDEIELMNENARERKEKDIESKIRDLQEFDQEAKAELTKERDDMVRDILKEMNDVIREYGEQNGYSVILNDRVLLYGEPSMDLTEEIIKVLNSTYKE